MTAKICRDTVFGGAFVTVNSTVVEDGERMRSVGGCVNMVIPTLDEVSSVLIRSLGLAESSDS